VKQQARTTTRLERPVVVVVKTKAQCVEDPDLEAFAVEDGPAAEECESIRRNLLSGDAVEQTVAMLKEDGAGRLLGLVSVRFDGRANWREPFAKVPPLLKKLSRTAYINVLARDTRLEGCVLADGETRLGDALVRAGLELATFPDARTPLPLCALALRENHRSHRAFEAQGFRVHADSWQCNQDVLVRRGGRPLLKAPPHQAYSPLRAVFAARQAS
jgi:hypothetical protein